MRHRTKNHLLTQEQIEALFKRAEVGRIATLNKDGYPYVLPMHFVYADSKIYVHGLPKGQKIDNIKSNPKVCFEIDEMISLLYDGIEEACDVNTEFNSIIVQGNAIIVEEFSEKREALSKIVEKFTPHLMEKELPDAMINGTAVIRIDIVECIGRYYK
ncbi:MAG: pyridoxamine 5'-phosphate oxidase family protein [Sulfuricurvum sp.]|uniref:pyridoxamine 5'-phosphate oxidase family protein n=1 Tax=Sulfuricurvum sp. TaxID=2025608 RepID=UPI00271F2B77|nr:pyridoxamine 5'-phosphate oxidase family protein [Sulfuricurvum sp.]MDO9055373.1 pyridoxamine 5'-phosphate oxidase family protein [Sulfuricurvum sp.]